MQSQMQLTPHIQMQLTPHMSNLFTLQWRSQLGIYGNFFIIEYFICAMVTLGGWFGILSL